MSFFRNVGNLLTVMAWRLVGNWVGEQPRRLYTGEPGHLIRFSQTGQDGELVITTNPLVTNLVPAVMVNLAVRSRWLWAFTSGVITGGLIGERYKSAFFELITRESE